MYKKVSAAVLAASIGLGSGSVSAMLPSGGFGNPFFVNTNSGLPLNQDEFDCMFFWDVYDGIVNTPLKKLWLCFTSMRAFSKTEGSNTVFFVFKDSKLIAVSERICALVKRINAVKQSISKGLCKPMNGGLIDDDLLQDMIKIGKEIDKINGELGKVKVRKPKENELKKCEKFSVCLDIR